MLALQRRHLRTHLINTLAATFLLLCIVQRIPFCWPPGYDAWSYLAAARAVLHGYNPTTTHLEQYVPDVALSWLGQPLNVGAYLYPPVLALLHVPLAILPFNVALAIWMSFVAASAALLVWALQQLVGRRIALVACLGFAPLWSSLWLGQINTVIALLLTLTVIAARREQPARQGIWLVLGALLKVTPAVSLLMLMQRRQWRSVGSAALLATCVVTLTLPITGLQGWLAGSTAALRVSFDSDALVSLTAYTFRLPAGYREVATWGLMLSMLGITMLRAQRVPLQLALAATIILPMLIARITWDHHTVMALPALAILWTWSQRGRIMASSAWLALSISGGITIPIVLLLCWLICCWPSMLEDRADDQTSVLLARLSATNDAA